MLTRNTLLAGAAALVALALVGPAAAQAPIKLGELNSYKVFPAFLEPYKKGWELAVEEVNAAGGVLGRKIEVVSRDDNGNPGDAVRVAEELLSREGASILIGDQQSRRRSCPGERAVAPPGGQILGRCDHERAFDGAALHPMTGEAVRILDVIGDVSRR